jgi:hypothetical protein
MKLPLQRAAVVRDTISATWHPSSEGAVAPQGRLGQGPECPPNSGSYCDDGYYCCYNTNSRTYSCSSTAC